MSKTTTETSSPNYDLPPDLRVFAEKSVEQARQAFEGFITAAHRTAAAFEGQAQAARQGAKDVGQKALAFAERNVESSFDLVQKLVRAKDAKEMMALQADYIRNQMQALSEQARELGEETAKVAKDAASAPR
ncbi:MAG: hypothetical protein QOI12_56 [Alphaproteobacteria bacterium]|jgi:phasin|nr:hypothetical protein [Alphaproteobacteria bacterium]